MNDVKSGALFREFVHVVFDLQTGSTFTHRIDRGAFIPSLLKEGR